MATNKNNVDTEKNNLFVLSGDQEEKTPFEYDGMPEFEQDKKESETNEFQLDEVLFLPVDRIMLDNWDPKKALEAVKKNKIKK